MESTSQARIGSTTVSRIISLEQFPEKSRPVRRNLEQLTKISHLSNRIIYLWKSKNAPLLKFIIYTKVQKWIFMPVFIYKIQATYYYLEHRMIKACPPERVKNWLNRGVSVQEYGLSFKHLQQRVSQF